MGMKMPQFPPGFIISKDGYSVVAPPGWKRPDPPTHKTPTKICCRRNGASDTQDDASMNITIPTSTLEAVRTALVQAVHGNRPRSMAKDALRLLDVAMALTNAWPVTAGDIEDAANPSASGTPAHTI